MDFLRKRQAGMDPFVQVKCGGGSHEVLKTKHHINGGAEPNWSGLHNVMKLRRTPNDDNTIVISVLDRDLIRDDYIGGERLRPHRSPALCCPPARCSHPLPPPPPPPPAACCALGRVTSPPVSAPWVAAPRVQGNCWPCPQAIASTCESSWIGQTRRWRNTFSCLPRVRPVAAKSVARYAT